MDKKTILYVHHGKGLGGAPLSLLYLIQNLDKKKYIPQVLFLHDSPAMDLYKELGIQVFGPVKKFDFPHTKVWWLRWYHAPFLARCMYDTWTTMMHTANKWLERIKPDLLHLNTSSLIAWGKVARKKNIPVVWHIREPLAQGYLGVRKNTVINFIKKYATAIVPICYNDAKPWKKLSKTHVVYNTVDEKIFDANISGKHFIQQYKLSENDPKILFVGGLSQEKGTLLILKVLEQVLRVLPQTKLLIAGYFDLQKKNFFNPKTLLPASKFTTEVASMLGALQHSIVLLGAIRTIPEAMAASNVVVFPATVGHFARPIIEAGFMKKPVVASNLHPLDELVVDTQTGFLVHPSSHTVWAKKLISLLSNTARAEHMGEQGYKFCRNKFGLKNHIKQIETIYDDILKKGKGHATKTT